MARSQARRAAGGPAMTGEPDPCETCRDAKVLKARTPGEFETRIVRCPDCYEPLSLDDRLRLSGVVNPTDFASWRPVPEMAEAYEACQQLLRGERWCVFLRGVWGCGKTHLAKATTRAWLESEGTAIFRKVPRLLDELRDTYDRANRTRDEDEQARSWHSLTWILDAMRGTGLLVLDDLGAQSQTPWASEKLYTVIDDRYEAKAPLVVTSNVRSSEEREMERTLDRLAPGLVVIKEGASRRMVYDR